MLNIVGVKTAEYSSITYYKLENNVYVAVGDYVCIKKENLLIYAKIILKKQVSDEKKNDFLPIFRLVNKDDIKNIDKIKLIETNAHKKCTFIIRKENLNMKLLNVEYQPQNSKLLFYFKSEERVDFRRLAKDLASYFKVRIEFRQIGVRDQAKLIGGIGICGRLFCCRTFLDSFETVSIKMVKEQVEFFNSSKISGVCGRLMCCLKYEHVNETSPQQKSKN